MKRNEVGLAVRDGGGAAYTSWIFAVLLIALTLGVGASAWAQSPGERGTAAVVSNVPGELNALIAEPPGRPWLVRGIDVAGLGFVDFDVAPVKIFDPAARVYVNGAPTDTPPTDARFLRGGIANVPGSVVALTVRQNGGIQGLATDGNSTWRIERQSTAQALQVTEIEPHDAAPPPFACGQEKLLPLDASEGREAPGDLDAGMPPAASSLSVAALSAGQYYRVKVAIETDYEFFQRFGSTAAANEYIGTLFNYIGGIYENQVSTRFLVGDVSLWTTSADPWVENGDTLCRLLEFTKYWRDNHAGIDRTIAHFLSGASLGGGIAFLDGLCSTTETFSYAAGCASLGTTYVAGGFGLSANLNGTIQDSSGIAWDGVVVAHEIGHNFSSPHTHCYSSVEGVANPVDACWNEEESCWNGSLSLPGIGSLTGGTARGRNGTIMSYCHQRSGGIQNIAATFGIDHAYGVRADRVANKMFNRVAQVAAANPACIPVVDGSGTTRTLTVNATGASGVAIAGSPAALGGTTNYTRSWIASGTAVTLTAPATAGGANFVSWSGCDATSSANRTCTLTLNADRTVTVAYASGGGGDGVLTNGVPVTNLSGATGSQRYFSLAVPAGASNLTIQTSGGTGDVDLYVKRGSQPTTSSYDCRPFLGGNAETCSWATPTAGTYYVMLRGYSAYSGVTLLASYTTGSGTTRTLTVNSTGASGVAIAGSPAALGGTTDYTRTGIASGTAVTLTAPATSGGASFSAWTGCDATSSANRTCTLTLNADRTATVAYASGGGGDGVLTNGVPVTNLSGATGSQRYFSLEVPAGASNLTIQTSGGSGDADLYVRRGSQPTTSSYDCRPYKAGNAETCSWATPTAGTYYVMLRGYSAYSGVTLLASYTTGSGTTRTLTVNSTGAAGVAIAGSPAALGGTTDYTRTGLASGTAVTLTAPATAGGASFSAWTGCDATSSANRTCTLTLNADRTATVAYASGGGGDGVLTNGVPVTNLSGAAGSQRYFSLEVPAGASNLTIQTSGGSGDADLYVRRGSQPTTSSYDCRPWKNGNAETCSWASPAAGTYYVMLRGYSAYSGVTLLATH